MPITDPTTIATLGAMFGSALTALSQFAIARLTARSKGEKGADLIQKYIAIADVTADQLEERLNLISKMDNRISELTINNRTLNMEVDELKLRRKERDDQMVVLEASMMALREQVNQDAAERGDLRKKLSEFEVKYRAMWQWLLALLEQIRRHGGFVPVEPPPELATDPEIAKIMQEIKGKQ